MIRGCHSRRSLHPAARVPPPDLRHFFLTLVPLLLTGCGLLPPLGSGRLQEDVRSVKGIAPEKWAALPNLPASAATGWLGDFESKKLSALVERAITANPDLKAAAARVDQARAQTVQAGAALLPTISGSYSAARNQTPADQRFPGLNFINNRFRLPLNVSWEIDLWGRVADERGAAKADRLAAEETFYAARLALAANTVRTAITLAEAQALLRLAEQDVRTRRVQLGILEKQMERGLDPDRAALDVSLSRADLARSEVAIQQRRASADQSRRALEVLLGGYPAGKEPGLDTLPTLRREVPAGLPSELLLRRPDLRAAERRLESALRSESAAKKAFLPSLNITGSAGFSTEDLVFLLDKDSLIWSIAGGVAQRLFEGGRIKANIELAKGRYEEALATYAGSVLTAFREVETAIAAEAFFVEQEHALDQAVTEAERSVKLAAGQYDRGLADILTLLDAQQRAFDARSSLLGAKAQRLRNRADLHLALGGEF